MLANLYTTARAGNIRSRGKGKAAVGRFTKGGRRSGHVFAGTRVDRHTLERVCLGKFRVTMGATRPCTVVASCGLVGKIRSTGGCSVLRGVTHSR